MALQGRVATVLLGILTVLAVAVAGVAISLQMREHDLRLTKEKEFVWAKAENEDLQQQLQEVRQAKQQVEAEVARAKEQLELASQQLIDERQAKETLAQAVEERQREIDRLGKDVEQIRSERAILTEQLAQLKGEREALQTQLTQAEQAKTELETKLQDIHADSSVELEKVVVTSDDPGETSLGRALAQQGQIMVVNREYEFIVMNMGKNQGLAIGQEFQIVRGQEILGRVKVEKVYDELSAAAILPQSNKDAIREGDVVKAL